MEEKGKNNLLIIRTLVGHLSKLVHPSSRPSLLPLDIADHSINRGLDYRYRRWAFLYVLKGIRSDRLPQASNPKERLSSRSYQDRVSIDSSTPFRLHQLYPFVVAFFAWTFAVYDFLLFGLLLPVLAKEFNWTATQSVSIAFWVTIASFFCSLLVGPIADGFGRRNALVLTVGGAALSSGLTAFTTGPLSLILARSLSGLGYSEQAVQAAYLAELEAVEKRGRFYGFIQGGWPFGQLLATGAAGLLLPWVGWRGVFLIASFPAVIILLARLWLPESPYFLRLRRFRQLYRRNPEVAVRYALKNRMDVESSRQFLLTQLLAPELRGQFLFLLLAFFFNWFAGEIFTVLITTLLTQFKGLSYGESLWVFGLGSAVAYVGYVTHGLLGHILGRRETVAMAWTASAVAYAALLFLAKGFWTVTLLYALADFWRAGAYGALFPYIAESFPTRVRASATTFINAIGPLGAIVSSLLFSIALAHGISGIYASFWIGVLPTLFSGLLLLCCRRVPPGMELDRIGQ
ncbi:MFS transporter [Candidatus Methylacidiphilum infernorum]|uniref:Permease of the major facilitator superfamily n=1 Tax=Methylacidiphilum infernorum (isolate V4) TaxID=481448 RepID=B3E0F1_METI4|nr:MFS transporter [Candidatus Methylacidiphilum infernorum]ACD84380.1 Permease of the major facilitator superfamily [Methylacidiphilum infernorum V4]